MAEFEHVKSGKGAPFTGSTRKARPLPERGCGFCCWAKMRRQDNESEGRALHGRAHR